MKLNIIKLLSIAVVLGSLTFIKVENIRAECIVCDGGAYRGGGCDGWDRCTGYNMGCQSPNGAHCGDCWRCVNGSYVPSGDHSCDQYGTPWCTRGANYYQCWPRWNYSSGSYDTGGQFQYLWYGELGQSNNYLCSNPSVTSNVSSLAVGSSLNATWISNYKSSSDWIGLFTVGASDSSPTLMQYINNCPRLSGGTYSGSGYCTFTPTSGGTYELRFFTTGRRVVSGRITVASPPRVTYFNAWGYGPNGASGKQLTNADSVCRGDTVRFYMQFADDKTPNSQIKYYYGGNPEVWASTDYSANSWNLVANATTAYYGSSDYWYYDWKIPTNAPLDTNGIEYYTWYNVDSDGGAVSSWGTTDGTESKPGFKIIDPALTAPTNLTPLTGTTIDFGPQNITWSAVTNAKTYYVGIDDLDDAWPGALDTSATVSGTSYTYDFKPSHRYHIWVNALNVCGTSGPQTNTTITVKTNVPPPTVSPAPSIASGCSTGNIMFISWMNTDIPVTWVDIAESDPSFNTYYHKSIPSELQKANQPGGTYAPDGFYGCGTMCGNKVPGDKPLKICEGKTYYVRLFNGTDYSYSTVTVDPIPTATPQPWTKTHGGDVHVNQ